MEPFVTLGVVAVRDEDVEFFINAESGIFNIICAENISEIITKIDPTVIIAGMRNFIFFSFAMHILRFPLTD